MPQTNTVRKIYRGLFENIIISFCWRDDDRTKYFIYLNHTSEINITRKTSFILIGQARQRWHEKLQLSQSDDWDSIPVVVEYKYVALRLYWISRLGAL